MGGRSRIAIYRSLNTAMPLARSLQRLKKTPYVNLTSASRKAKPNVWSLPLLKMEKRFHQGLFSGANRAWKGVWTGGVGPVRPVELTYIRQSRSFQLGFEPLQLYISLSLSLSLSNLTLIWYFYTERVESKFWRFKTAFWDLNSYFVSKLLLCMYLCLSTVHGKLVKSPFVFDIIS